MILPPPQPPAPSRDPPPRPQLLYSSSFELYIFFLALSTAKWQSSRAAPSDPTAGSCSEEKAVRSAEEAKQSKLQQ